jgi:hypothetical protein
VRLDSLRRFAVVSLRRPFRRHWHFAIRRLPQRRLQEGLLVIGHQGVMLGLPNVGAALAAGTGRGTARLGRKLTKGAGGPQLIVHVSHGLDLIVLLLALTSATRRQLRHGQTRVRYRRQEAQGPGRQFKGLDGVVEDGRRYLRSMTAGLLTDGAAIAVRATLRLAETSPTVDVTAGREHGRVGETAKAQGAAEDMFCKYAGI